MPNGQTWKIIRGAAPLILFLVLILPYTPKVTAASISRTVLYDSFDGKTLDAEKWELEEGMATLHGGILELYDPYMFSTVWSRQDTLYGELSFTAKIPAGSESVILGFADKKGGYIFIVNRGHTASIDILNPETWMGRSEPIDLTPYYDQYAVYTLVWKREFVKLYINGKLQIDVKTLRVATPTVPATPAVPTVSPAIPATPTEATYYLIPTSPMRVYMMSGTGYHLYVDEVTLT